VGLLGLIGNAAATWVLARGDRTDLNLEAVLRHSFADALGSLAVVLSGTVILITDWTPVDTLASLGIAALILASSVKLITGPLDVLMEAAPPGVDIEELGQAMCAVGGVRAVHELHVWTVTSGFDALAAHVVVDPDADRDRARRELELLLRERYGIEHTTLQMEEHVRERLLHVDTGTE
jgi:cobalt-zinc-cadmium efflux system protein